MRCSRRRLNHRLSRIAQAHAGARATRLKPLTIYLERLAMHLRTRVSTRVWHWEYSLPLMLMRASTYREAIQRFKNTMVSIKSSYLSIYGRLLKI